MNLRLLLLEDNPRDEELILRALKKDGFEVRATVVRSQAELQGLQDQTFDAVVADYRLPDGNAVTAIGELRQRLPDAPMVIVSGSTTEEQLLAMLRIGADDYLLKDRLVRLGAALRSAQERHRLRAERAAAEAAVRQREAELRHLQRVESIGLLTGGIAHDFNNLLTVVLGNADLALTLIDPSKPAYALVREVTSAARRAATLTQQLLSFARRQSVGPQALDLGDVVRSFLGMARPVLGRGVSIELDVAKDLGRVHVDRLQIEQVLMNLLLNARDAMPDGGRVEVRVGPAARAGMAEVRVRDHGTGIRPEVRSRLFEPFFTTKPTGIGTGLGLSTSLAIVRQFGGDITITPDLATGSEFRVTLPLCPTPARAPEVLSPAAAPGPTILVVEAEPLLRNTVAQMLVQAGYQVVVAASAHDEQTLARAATHPIDLVLAEAQDVDAVTSWLGRQFGSRRHPPVMQLDGSGRPRGPQVREVLLKPFTAQELLHKVRELCPTG
ncbi:MAG: response regulator [Planctomycetota bacterium]